MHERRIVVQGATQNNLRDVDVAFGPGLTTVVGPSGSGKSSLVFDVVYHEARRRFMETISLGSPWSRVPAAHVRSVNGLGPAVAIAQNVLNRNPNSTVASALGVHPFLRILFARFCDVLCPRCGSEVVAMSDEERVAAVVPGPVTVPLVRGVEGTHARLLRRLAERFGRDAVLVDGRRWNGRTPRADAAHDIDVVVAVVEKMSQARAALESADALGSAVVVSGGRTMSRSSVCGSCLTWVRPPEPMDFRPGATDTSSFRVDGRTLEDVLSRTSEDVLQFLNSVTAPAADRIVEEVRRRLRPMLELGLDHLTLDRPMPTLSRGEAQRVRLAVVLAGRLEDLLHVLDEPTIGLHRADAARLLGVLGEVPGPVLMVEHDATAAALADEVVEVGPGGGRLGGQVLFQGPPAQLWQADTPSGAAFSGRHRPPPRARREAHTEFLTVRGASARNLTGIDVSIPIGALTVITGPSGAGKTTLVRDVLLASLDAEEPVDCTALDGPRLRVHVVDQSPIGNNPRSNPATYTKVFDRIRTAFARESGASASLFTFNRPEGACPECEGMGALEVQLRYVAASWVTCEACEGRRYNPEALEHRFGDRTIADVLDLSVDEALELFSSDRTIARGLRTLSDVGLGYITLGQPSPSLSGGEAQRVKLARQLGRVGAGDLVVLDEPTTGLHPDDLARLVSVIDGFTRDGCTVVVIEHQPDVIAAADWVIDLGPGAGPRGGRLVHCGPPGRRETGAARPRRAARRKPRSADAIRIRGARANNLHDVSVDIPKNRFTVVTGVSGSGKSSLVSDVLEAEAVRRLLECLSVYERQSANEGPAAPVESITGLGPTLVLSTERASGSARATVGGATELDRLLSIAVCRGGHRRCLHCGGTVVRTRVTTDAPWQCRDCGAQACAIEPRHLQGTAANAICKRCRGMGNVRVLVEERLVAKPDKPICGGALFSPGYYPKSYFCTPGTGGYQMMRFLSERYAFDPATTPWNEMSAEARHAFLYGDPEPMVLHYEKGSREFRWRGVFSELTGDLGGLYSRGVECDDCHGKRLRPDYLAVTLGGFDRADLFSMPLVSLGTVLDGVERPDDEIVAESLDVAIRRLRFLREVGLGYVNLDRRTLTLSAGEAQRVKLAAVLGGELVGMTVLMDEPSRGLHPREVDALATTLRELSTAGNTVVVVEHDTGIIAAADHEIVVGPGAGRDGGRIVSAGKPVAPTASVASGSRTRRSASGWMVIAGARGNNLSGEDVRIPLGCVVGVCGVSGSGKSSLIVDTLGLALVPPKRTATFSAAQYEPGPHDEIRGAPKRVLIADQARESIVSPGMFLGLVDALRRTFGSSDDAVSQGVDFDERCDACYGRGSIRHDMGFLPSVVSVCDACDGSGYRSEARAVRLRGIGIAEAELLTIAALGKVFGDVPAIGRTCDAARRVGVDYLVVRQPAWSLSGGEAQRLKLAKELAKPTTQPALYLMDEPTVGLHTTDVARLVAALDEVAGAGHSVVVVEHNPQLLRCCDWLIELGPGAGPEGGRVIAEGPPEQVAEMDTPTAPYLLTTAEREARSKRISR